MKDHGSIRSPFRNNAQLRQTGNLQLRASSSGPRMV